MSSPPASKKISYGDTAYDTVYTAWVENGRPHQFDRMGSWGGALYRVVDPSQTYPDFYQARSELPTEFNDNSASSSPSQKGWWLQNRSYGMIKGWWTYKGAPHTKLRKYQGNELDPEDTV